MKALSIRQPWAWLICAGLKNIENRPWPTNYRGRIYVHAGQRFDWAGYSWVGQHGELLRNVDVGKWIELALARPTGIIGEVDIVGCVTMSESPWFAGPYGLVLARPQLYEKPIPMRGHLGLFEVEVPKP